MCNTVEYPNVKYSDEWRVWILEGSLYKIEELDIKGKKRLCFIFLPLVLWVEMIFLRKEQAQEFPIVISTVECIVLISHECYVLKYFSGLKNYFSIITFLLFFCFDRQLQQRERSSICCLSAQMDTFFKTELIQIQESVASPRFPTWVQGPKVSIILHCLPKLWEDREVEQPSFKMAPIWNVSPQLED